MNPTEVVERLREMWQRRGGMDDRTGPLAPIRPDWRDYFRRFCEAHGRQPLLYAGKLLFPDGWTCSATDHAGPYWPAPENEIERVRLQRSYWKLRRSAIRKDIPAARLRVEQLTELATGRELPVRVHTALYDKEKGQWIRGKEPIEAGLALQDAQQRLAWLEEDLRLCDLMLIDPNADPIEVELEVPV